MDFSSMTKVVEGIYKKSESTYYLICTITKEPLYCSKERLDKLVARYGSLENVAKNTVSRDAKKLLNDRNPITTVAKMSSSDLRQTADMIRKDEAAIREANRIEREKAEPKKKVYPRIIFENTPRTSTVLKPDMKELIESITKNNTCWYARYNIDNGGYCNGCYIEVHCAAACKKFRKKPK